MNKVNNKEMLYLMDECTSLVSRCTWYINTTHGVNKYTNSVAYTQCLLKEIKMLLITLNEYINTNDSTLTHEEVRRLYECKSTLIELNDTINNIKVEIVKDMTISERLHEIINIDNLNDLVDEVVENYTDSKETNKEVYEVINWINERLESGYYASRINALNGLRENKVRLLKLKESYGYEC